MRYQTITFAARSASIALAVFVAAASVEVAIRRGVFLVSLPCKALLARMLLAIFVFCVV